ncbi:MAG: polysaccharide deacetylase family protein [Clostridia bacterium]|nr:polysaccharide deacetylase family protein [Clostridia bacterium]
MNAFDPDYYYRFLRFPGGLTKTVTFSYDDGVCSDLRLAALFNQHGLKGTFNLNSKKIGAPGHLDAEMIQQEILGKGHEVAIHGAMHRAMGKLSSSDAIREVLLCRLSLEEAFGQIIRGMAYADSGITQMIPGNSFEQIRSFLSSLGIAYARTLGTPQNTFELPEDFLCWMPTGHHDEPDLLKRIDRFLEIDTRKLYIGDRTPKLLYIWGHSFEFDRNNNWPHIEQICRQISGDPDVWYATNMEICEYVNDYNRLVVSADGRRIFNPTFRTIWLSTGEDAVTVHPGETILL